MYLAICSTIVNPLRCCLPNHVTVVVLVCVILVCGRDHSLCQFIGQAGATTCMYMYTDCILASAL